MIDINEPDHIKYVLKNEKTIEGLNKFLKPEHDDNIDGWAVMQWSPYIRIDIIKRSYSYTFDYEWLYRQDPNILEVNQIKSIIRRNKLENLFVNDKRVKSERVYNQKDINKVIYSLKLKDVIGDHISLKKKGKDYVGRCPMCKEFTTNNSYFRVSEIKNVYKCFQCGIAGTKPTRFIMQYYGVTFDKALVYLNKVYLKYDLIPEKNRVVKRKTIKGDNLPF